ncbi:hypothetical protein DSL72_005370 [Monilinia vaccinii-corymbosi]|uniref:Uncharacterized protein n=1 Tax=Monilinia vaccinii-corymbosi TaxID=61207 RepID=A0A8A3PF64_9HELO|nr:hypothetical protein DSL72_005370 [Monilinia vaccinii-corymbosi]
MARKLKSPIPSPPRSISDSSSDDDGALIYTPGPSSPTYPLDPNHLSEVIQGLQNVKLAKDNVDESEQESIKDVPTERKKGRRSGAKKSIPADIAVDNVTDGIQILAVADRECDIVKQERTNAKSAKNRREKERKKRRKARMVEEEGKRKTDSTIANDKSKYRILKDAGYSGMKQFMDFYGLRLHDPQDIALARKMIKLMGEDAQGNSSNNQLGSVEGKDSEPEEQTDGKQISNSQWLKTSRWKNIKLFMIAHGFKWGEFNDHMAAKELIESLKKDQASEKQAEQPHMPKKEEAKTVEKVDDSSAKLTTAKTKKTTVVGLWEDYFGNETQLANWQRLCVDVGMEEVPNSITQCRKALGKVWVNIFDFLDAKAEGKPVKRYESEQKLAKYTMKSGKIYPKKQAKQGGPARVLLAHIFRH